MVGFTFSTLTFTIKFRNENTVECLHSFKFVIRRFFYYCHFVYKTLINAYNKVVCVCMLRTNVQSFSKAKVLADIYKFERKYLNVKMKFSPALFE